MGPRLISLFNRACSVSSTQGRLSAAANQAWKACLSQAVVEKEEDSPVGQQAKALAELGDEDGE